MRRPWSGCSQERSATATATQRHLCCSPRRVTDKISAVGAAAHSHRPRKSPATLAGHVQSHQSARLANSHCLEYTPLPARWRLLKTFEFLRGGSSRDPFFRRGIHPSRDQRTKHLPCRTASSSIVANPAASVEPSSGQKSQELGLAPHFFRTPLMWNSATDFPAMVLGTISV
jgi:hypothetical protein